MNPTMLLLTALASHAAGIQVTMYPGRAIIDIGYGGHDRFEGKTLAEAAAVAAEMILKLNSPAEVVAALVKLPFVKP
jgi:hypothetical protein